VIRTASGAWESKAYLCLMTFVFGIDTLLCKCLLELGSDPILVIPDSIDRRLSLTFIQAFVSWMDCWNMPYLRGKSCLTLLLSLLKSSYVILAADLPRKLAKLEKLHLSPSYIEAFYNI
jgi:hypothetical protein